MGLTRRAKASVAPSGLQRSGTLRAQGLTPLAMNYHPFGIKPVADHNRKPVANHNRKLVANHNRVGKWRLVGAPPISPPPFFPLRLILGY